MTGKKPFFSVVTPSFNQAQWLEGCIQSVLAQGADDFEHIVFDNCSADGTREILQRHPHLRWVSEPDHGQSDALNKGFRAAQGEVICWLNADDQYLAGVFDVVRRELSKPGVDVIFGDAQEVYFDGRPAGVRKARFERREDILFWWEKRVDILQPAVFFRRSVLDRIGLLREDLHVIMDTELWWRMSERFPFHYLGVPLAVQQRQPESKTMRHAHRIYQEKARVFGPVLRERDPKNALRHWLARRISMGRRYLGLAQSAGRTDPGHAMHLMGLSAGENPLLLAHPAWIKAALYLLSNRLRQTASR